MLESELSLSLVSGILRGSRRNERDQLESKEGKKGRKERTNGLPEDGMSVTRDDLSSVQGLPDVLRDLLVRSILSDLLLHSSDPVENLLVGETERNEGDVVVSFAKLDREGIWKGKNELTREGVQRDR